MGAVSRGARGAGGRTFGVILRRFIDKNVACPDAHAMEALDDMRSRKRGLDESGDAFVALPGGLGTLEELLEHPRRDECRDHWLRAVLTDPRRPDNPLGRLRTRYDFVAEIGFDRGDTAPAGGASTNESGAPTDPLALAEAFVHHVTETPAGDPERRALRDAVEAVRARQVPA